MFHKCPKSLECKWYALRGNLEKPHCKMNGLVLVWSPKNIGIRLRANHPLPQPLCQGLQILQLVPQQQSHMSITPPLHPHHHFVSLQCGHGPWWAHSELLYSKCVC
jgi:hypothetical protein